MVKNQPVMWETQIRSLGQEDLLEKGIATHSSILWRRQWQPTPVLLPGKSHGWRSLVDYSPWDCKESDTTERLHFHKQENIGVKALRLLCPGVFQGKK